jgi:hypothetical protein
MEETREQKAARFVEESGKKTHANDCSTSIAPAEEPGLCDCHESDPIPPNQYWKSESTEYWKALSDAEKIRLLIDANHKSYIAWAKIRERLNVYEPPESDEEA